MLNSLLRKPRRLLHERKTAKDPRTALCFAYYKGSSSFGLATVPCDKVTHLLTRVPTSAPTQ